MARSIRKYSPQDREAVLAIIANIWGEQGREVQEYLWDWKHERDEPQGDEGQSSWVVEVDGRIEGYTGNLPLTFKLDGENYLGGGGLDLVTMAGAKGFGVRLMKHQLSRCDMLMGTATLRARKLWDKVVGHDVTIREAVKCLYPTRMSLLLRKRLPGAIALFLGFLWDWYDVVRRRVGATKIPDNAVLEPIVRFTPETEAFFEDFAQKFRFTTLRSAEYLTWRYFKSPLHYDLFQLRVESKIEGVVAYRLATVGGIPQLIILDIAATGKAGRNYRILLDHCYSVAKSRRVAALTTIDPGCSVLSEVLGEFGFFKKRMVGFPIIGSMRMNSNPPKDIYGGVGWYITLSDSDLEFAVLGQYAELHGNRTYSTSAECAEES